MFLSRLKKKGIKLNWRYALGEIVLIFVAVNLAVWVNGWNDNRKERESEKILLLELKKALENDKEDLEVNISTFKVRIYVLKIMEKELLNGSCNFDSLEANGTLAALLGVSKFVSNTAPFEHAKLNGLNILTNDSLRISLLKYYDYYIEGIEFGDDVLLSLHTNHFYPDFAKPCLTSSGSNFQDLSVTFNEDCCNESSKYTSIISYYAVSTTNAVNSSNFLVQVIDELLLQIDDELNA